MSQQQQQTKKTISKTKKPIVPPNTTVLFNSEFAFDFDTHDSQKDSIAYLLETQKRKREQQELKEKEEKSKNEAEEDEDDDEFKDFAEDANKKSKKQKKNEAPSEKDLVRLKTLSVKKKCSEEEENFFEMPSNSESTNLQETSSFEEMNLSKPLIKALASLGMTSPTTIQKAAVPTALMGKDICACAVTGSGKTLAFMLPTVERLLYKPKFPQVTRVLVLTPTRELAVQICKVTRELTQFTGINTCLCAGGFDIKTQEASLRMGPDIVIATPGRLIDHLQNTPCFNLESVEILVLDEADRMLDEYFAEQLKEVMRLCSTTHQTMLFSATMTDKVDDLVNMSLKRPVKIFINENSDVTPFLKQEFVRLRDSSERNREALLVALIQRKFNDRVIVFVRTKQDCHRICLLLNMFDIKAAELHGGLTQTQRIEKLGEFKDETLGILVATDLAARGLDVANVKTVINFSMPMTFKHYIHRVGRTARAQASGRSISLVGEADRWLVKEIMRSSKIPVKCRVIPNDVIEHYRVKVDENRQELLSTLNDEKDSKLIEELEKDINRAKYNLDKKPGSGTSRKDIKTKLKKADQAAMSNKRTWLKNVDYKNGGLISENKKKERLEKGKKKNSDDKAPKKKAKFASKKDAEQHDNIFSKKYKQNQIN